MMKKIVSLLLAAALLLTSFAGCSRKKNDEEQTTEPTENVTAENPGAPFFMLTNLPEIGAYNGAGAYARWYPEYTDTFKPSKEYGSLIVFIGDTRNYDMRSENEVFEDLSLYGLATTDGKVVVDPVYSSAYAEEDDSGNVFLVLIKGENIKPEQGDFEETVTVIPQDGSWDITLKGYSFHGANSQRLVFAGNDQIKVFDYSAKLLFTLPGYDDFGYRDGYMVMYAPEQDISTTEQPTVPATAAPTVPATQPPVQAPTEQPSTAAPTTRAPAPATNPPTTASPAVDTTAQNSAVGAMSAPQVTPMALASAQNINKYTVIDTDGNVVITGLSSADAYFQNGYMPAAINDKNGIISFTGQWVVPPIYESTAVFYGKYFLLNDGINTRVVDISLKQVAKYSSSINRVLNYVDGRVTYNVENEYNDKLGRADIIIHDLLTDKAVVNTQSGLPATGYFEDSDLFYTIGKDKVCYVFGADGKTVSSYENVADIREYDGLRVVSVGTEEDSVDRVYDQDTNKLLFSYQSAKNENYTYCDPTGKNQEIVPLYHYGKSNSIDIINTSTGKFLIKGCNDAIVQYVNGRAYISVAYDSYTAVYTGQLKLILKMTNQYTD